MIDFVGGWQKDGKNVLTNIYSHDKVYSYEQENFIYCESREGIYHNPATINPVSYTHLTLPTNREV